METSTQTSDGENTRTGISGLGNLGRQSLDRIQDDIEGVEAVAAADIDQAAVSKAESDYGVEGFEDYSEMIAETDLDAVVLTTPHALHNPQAREALENGIHVLLEKPFTIEPQHAADLTRLAEEKGLELGIGVQKRFQHYDRMKELVESGAIGSPVSIDASLEQNWDVGGWRENPELSGGGNLIDSGYHLIDGVLYITSADPAYVDASMDWQKEGIEREAKLEAGLYDGENTLPANIRVAGECDIEWIEDVEIRGTEGTIDWSQRDYEDQPKESELVVRSDGTEREVEFPEPDGTTAKLQDYFNAIQNDDYSPRAGGADSVRAVALIHGAYESENQHGFHPEVVETDVEALLDR